VQQEFGGGFNKQVMTTAGEAATAGGKMEPQFYTMMVPIPVQDVNPMANVRRLDADMDSLLRVRRVDLVAILRFGVTEIFAESAAPIRVLR
jgi:hypothetical protein